MVLLIPLCPLITPALITIYLPVTSHKHERAWLNTTNLPSVPEIDTKELGGLLHLHISAIINHKKKKKKNAGLKFTNITDVYKIYGRN